MHARVQLSLRYTLDVLVAGEGAPFSRTRHTALTVGVVASSLAVALAVPDLAEKIFAVTGATGGGRMHSCVLYCEPVMFHMQLPW